jgi:iron(III) transport system substrate-binding protein
VAIQKFLESRQTTVKLFVILALCGYAVLLVIMLLISFRVAKPLKELSAAAKKLGNGDFDVAIPQMKGHDEAMEYFKKLDQNIAQYTKSGSGPSKMVGPGECVIGIGFLHDGIYQILQGYDNIGLVVPEDGTSYEIGATAIFKGAAHPNAAKLWIEYALSPDCVNLAKDNGSYQFLVLDNAEQPKEAAEFGLDPENTIDYDFEDAKTNIKQYIEDYFAALGGSADDRFKTE